MAVVEQQAQPTVEQAERALRETAPKVVRVVVEVEVRTQAQAAQVEQVALVAAAAGEVLVVPPQVAQAEQAETVPAMCIPARRQAWQFNTWRWWIKMATWSTSLSMIPKVIGRHPKAA